MPEYLYGFGFMFLAVIVVGILILIAIIKAVAKKVVRQELEKRFGKEGVQPVAQNQPQIVYVPASAPVSDTLSVSAPDENAAIDENGEMVAATAVSAPEVAVSDSHGVANAPMPSVKTRNDLTGLTQPENTLLLDVTKRQRSIYIISYCVVLGIYAIVAMIIPPALSVPISIIATVMLMVLGGFGAFSHDVVVYLRSNGKHRSGGIITWIWAFIGGLVFGWFVLLLCHKFYPTFILGWRNLKTATNTKTSSVNNATQLGDIKSGNLKNTAGNNAKVGLSKTGKIWFGVISALYVAWLVLGLIGIISPETQILWDADDPFTIYALNRVTGVIMLATSFTYLIFFAFSGIVKCKKLTKIILLVVALVGCSVCDIVYFVAFPEELEILAYSHVTDIAFLKLGDRLMFTIALFASEIGLALLGLVGTHILKSKREPNWAQFLITIVLTYLMFVAVGAVIAISVVVLFYLGWKLIIGLLAMSNEQSILSGLPYDVEIFENGFDSVLHSDDGFTYRQVGNGFYSYKKVDDHTLVRDNDGAVFKMGPYNKKLYKE